MFKYIFGIFCIVLSLSAAAEETGPKAPKPLTGRSLQNMEAFARLLGYVRHFHPSDEATKTDWTAFAVDGVEAVEDARDAEELADILRSIFNPISPTVQLYLTGEKPPDPKSVLPSSGLSDLGVVAWRHKGFGGGRKKGMYFSTRIRAKSQSSLMGRVFGGNDPSELPDPFKPYSADLGGGVSCDLPLALYYDDKGTLPRPGPVDTEKTQALRHYTGNDRSTRLAAVVLAWNVFQHFYPYIDVVETDWSAMLKITLKAAAMDGDEREFLDTLRFMIAQLQDGHGYVYHASYREDGYLPLVWDWIENKLVVTHVLPDKASAGIDLKPGDVILSIDGIPASRALSEVERLISAATPQFKRYRALTELRRVIIGEEIVLEVQDGEGGSREVRLEGILPAKRLAEPRPPNLHEIRPGIFYVDISRLNDKVFLEALPDLERAAGIVFDFRGYPRTLNAVTFFSHLIENPVHSQQFHIPLVKVPDRKDLRFVRSGEWFIIARKPYLKAKKAFITDGRAISYAESCMGIVDHYKLGEIVGGPTAGTNGNVIPFALPGGYEIRWTGMKVLKHDGSQHHGVGILPTMPVSRTIKGVAEGRDELLERAVEAVM